MSFTPLPGVPFPPAMLLIPVSLLFVAPITPHEFRDDEGPKLHYHLQNYNHVHHLYTHHHHLYHSLVSHFGFVHNYPANQMLLINAAIYNRYNNSRIPIVLFPHIN